MMMMRHFMWELAIRRILLLITGPNLYSMKIKEKTEELLKFLTKN